MGYRIRNCNVATGFIPRDSAGKGEDRNVWPTKRGAEARCKKANAKAEKLGIETRFKVEEVAD